MSKRTFTKVDEMTFTVEETKTAKDTIKVSDTLANMAQIVGAIKKEVADIWPKKDQVNKWVEWYNMWVDILAEAKEDVKLGFSLPKKIELGEDFTLEGIDIAKLPTIDIKLNVTEDNKEK